MFSYFLLALQITKTVSFGYYSDYITYSTGTVTHTAYNTIQLLTPLLLNTTITTTMFLILMLF